MKPKVAFFDFASCEGCQLTVINLEEQVLKLIDIVDVVSFREAITDHSDDYDIAFVEGSIVRPIDEVRLKKIRENARVLVALGACATMGGVNAMRNNMSVEEAKEIVYGDNVPENEFFAAGPLKAVHQVVKVDFDLPGCPIDKTEFVTFVTSLLMGKTPKLPEYSVCVECKKNNVGCLFDEGRFCLGSISRAGCGAVCPANGTPCIGCRGPVDDPNTDSYAEVLEKHGFTIEDAKYLYKLFWSLEE